MYVNRDTGPLHCISDATENVIGDTMFFEYIYIDQADWEMLIQTK